MVSLAYILIYFRSGRLPWQGLNTEGKNHKQSVIAQKKKRTKISDLTKNLIPQVGEFLVKAYELAFSAALDYNGFRNLLQSMIKEKEPSVLQYDQVREKSIWNDLQKVYKKGSKDIIKAPEIKITTKKNKSIPTVRTLSVKELSAVPRGQTAKRKRPVAYPVDSTILQCKTRVLRRTTRYLGRGAHPRIIKKVEQNVSIPATMQEVLPGKDVHNQINKLV